MLILAGSEEDNTGSSVCAYNDGTGHQDSSHTVKDRPRTSQEGNETLTGAGGERGWSSADFEQTQLLAESENAKTNLS